MRTFQHVGSLGKRPFFPLTVVGLISLSLASDAFAYGGINGSGRDGPVSGTRVTRTTSSPTSTSGVNSMFQSGSGKPSSTTVWNNQINNPTGKTNTGKTSTGQTTTVQDTSPLYMNDPYSGRTMDLRDRYGDLQNTRTTSPFQRPTNTGGSTNPTTGNGEPSTVTRGSPTSPDEPTILDASTKEPTTTRRPGNEQQTSASTEGLSAEHSFASSTEMNEFGAQQSAAVAVTCLADGANNMLKNSAAGGFQSYECLKGMGAADKLHKLAEETAARGGVGSQGGLVASEDILNREDSQGAFADFEKNYKMGREEFVGRMLAAPGDPDEFSNTLSHRLSKEEVFKALADGDKLSDDQKQEILAKLNGRSSEIALNHKSRLKQMLAKDGPSIADEVREKLKQDMLAQERAKATRGEKRLPASQKMEKISALQDAFPVQAAAVQSSSDSIDELSIFEVVHRKYRDKFERGLSNRMN